MTGDKAPLPDSPPHSAQSRPPACENVHAWRASLAAAATLASACGLAAAPEGESPPGFQARKRSCAREEDRS
jgi:hypothetical protein